MAEGLYVITNDSEINTTNLMHNFYYLEKYLKVLALDASLIRGVALDTDFQDAVVEALSQDTSRFIANLATAIYNQPEFIERIVTEEAGVSGGTFDGLAHNEPFIENLVEEMVDNSAFITAFLNYFAENASELYRLLKSDVFRAYYGPDIDDFPFGTAETGDTNIIPVWQYPEPAIEGYESTKYIGVTFGYKDDLSNINIFISKNSAFPVAIQNPGSTGTIRLTADGLDLADDPVNATGYIGGAFFDPISGAQLIDITDLDWDGEEELYVKITGYKSKITYIRIGFDYAKHAAQTSVPTGGFGSGGTGYADVVIQTQTEWEAIAGADGHPEVAEGYYNPSTGHIEWPAGFKVILLPIDPNDTGVAGKGYVFDWGRAYTMYNPIYVFENVELEAQGKVTIVKRHADAIFRSASKITVGGAANPTPDYNRINVVFDEGEIKESDLIHYSGSDQYYYVVGAYAASNYIFVDRNIKTANASGKVVTVLQQNVKMSGFYYDGRGNVIEDQTDPELKTVNNEGGGFANFEALGNSIFDVFIVNCKAKNGGGVYLSKCFNIDFKRTIKFCEAEQESYAGGEGGAIYGGFDILAEADMCRAYTGGGFSTVKFSRIKAYRCTADVEYTENFYNCSFSEQTHYQNFNTIKVLARVKVDMMPASEPERITSLYTVPDGVFTVVQDFFVVVYSSDSVTNSGKIAIGSNASDYDNLFESADIELLNESLNEVYQPSREYGKMGMFEEGDVIKCKCTFNAQGTSQIVEVVLCGYEYQKL